MPANSPVAIIGIGCKFPGGSDTKDLYYEFLRNKGDGMVEPPPDRWTHSEWCGSKDAPGKYASSKGGFVNNIDLFDPLEFGISMKEAQYLDPSLRLTLEASHQALVDSGVDYRGSKTGVYVGQLLTSTDELRDDRYEINNHNGVGKCVAIRANRISFTFDLKGPSFLLDTACSSSGYAMHLALSAIRLGEIDQALVIGASTMVNPVQTVSFSKLGVLSPTGSSKSFDAAADGYARAEGFAAVLIKRQDLAIRDGDHIYSLVTGSAVNANGKGKSLTMPEADAQGLTIKAAYALADRSPADAFYVELHATGTLVGDPIEVNGAGRIFSQGRKPKNILRVGSVKGNMGHAEGCSFMASLIKVSLMLHNKVLIPNVRFNKPNPKIDFVKGMMQVQTELEKFTPEMAASDGRWLTSVSTYGVGGANAHVVLESYETVEEVSSVVVREPKSNTKPLYLFAAGTLTEGSLARWQTALTEHFANEDNPKVLRSVAREITRQARASPYRSFAVAPSLSGAIKWSKPALVSSEPKLCLVFSGQGPQHIYMGRQLAEAYPAFLEAIQANDDVLVNKYGKESFTQRTGLFIPGVQTTLASNGVWPVADVVLSLVFIQIALTDLVKSLGIQYEYVIGHSIGEIAMGYASGHYDRETAVGIAVARAAAMTKAEGNGAMVALGVGVLKAKLMIKKVFARAGVDSGLWIAGINSPKAVTIAGTHELIDLMVEVAADPADKVFAAKLRVGCAFHTPLMENQEALFKDLVGKALTKSNPPVAKVMSTVDGKWLDRDLDVQYCWDNIRQPVLFGTALNKIVQELGAENVSFLEIAPHPVLKSYIEEVGGNPISIIRRPNPKVPAQNTGEHYQFLEGIGNLMMTGYKYLDINKLCGRSDGIVDFIKPKLPAYPYSKTSCWAEAEEMKSYRLRPKPRPLSEKHFRINVDSHPDLTGHIVMEAVLYPGSGYVESILENGAFIIENMKVLKPFVLNGHDSDPGHAGCVIQGNTFEFRGSSDSKYENGNVILDTVYATGSFQTSNPAFDLENLPYFDVKGKLQTVLASITGDEFYENIPSSYGYKDHFKNYLKAVHAIPAPECWAGKAYLTRLEIPEGTPYVYGGGYVLHPGILDSITQCGLAMFMNMDTKTFDFNGTFLPVSLERFTRWDSKDAPNLEEHLKKGIWVYYKPVVWGAKGPFVSDYIITDNDGRVLITIDKFQIALAPEPEPTPINDYSMQQRIVTVFQPKALITPGYSLPATGGHAGHSYIAEVLESLLVNSKLQGGRYVSRVLDIDSSDSVARAVDTKLSHLLAKYQMAVDYFAAGSTAEDADAKIQALHYPHGRSTVIDLNTFSEDGVSLRFTTVDVILSVLNLAHVPANLELLPKFLVPSGAILILASTNPSFQEEEGFVSLTVDGLVEKLKALSARDVETRPLASGQTIVIARNFNPVSVPLETLTADVNFHHFLHGNEGVLVEKVQKMSSEGELWIIGNNDAAGIGALGVAAGLVAEEAQFTVHSVLFEDTSLSVAEREKWIHTIRQNPKILEDHLKCSKSGDVLVRRAVQGSVKVKPATIRSVGISTNSHGTRSISAIYPPPVGADEVEMAVETLGITDLSFEKPLVAFVGSYDGNKVVGVDYQKLVDTIVTRRNGLVTLPAAISSQEAVSLPTIVLPSWIALVEIGRINADSVVLIHDALSRAGRGAVQIVKRNGARAFFTVKSKAEAKSLALEFNIDASAISVNVSAPTWVAAAKSWLVQNTVESFDLVFNATGRTALATGVEIISQFGSYIHNKTTEDPVQLPTGAPSTRIVDVAALVKKHPAKLASFIKAVVEAHSATRFKLEFVTISFTNLTRPVEDISAFQVLVVNTVRPDSVRVDPAAQLFDPRKTYLLIGGCSEFGIGVTIWMFNHGARHIYLTSRRGRKALSPVDKLYLRHINNHGGDARAISSNALKKEDLVDLINMAKSHGPIGGIMLMTVVLRDSSFANLTQQHFDDVYESKVTALNVILSVIDLATIDFTLLFSTIGTVFGNAGQAPYLAAQLYLDKIAESLPNTISMSFPPITDSGIFKRLVQSTKGGANTGKLSKVGMTTPQVCEFIGDSLIRTIPHYLPLLNHKDCPEVFDTCEPLLFWHLLPPQLLAAGGAGKDEGGETPASILANLLGLSADQISDNALITSYGLDSLAATRLSSQLKAAFSISVSQIELLGSMTTGMLDELVSKSKTSDVAGDSSLAADDGSAKYGEPLVPVLNDMLAYDESYTTDASAHQYRIWLAQVEADKARKRDVSKIDPAMSRYGATQWDTHEGYFVTIVSKAPLDLERMTKAFAEVVNRHGALRTTFHWDDKKGKLMQTIHPSVHFENSQVIDLSDEPDAYKKAYEMSIAANMAPNFRLDQLPLVAAIMFKLGGDNYGFNITVHHIMTDETSLGIFFFELFELYMHGIDSLPPVQLHYSDFSDWLDRTADRRQEIRDEQLRYWMKNLEGVQPLHLTLARPSEVEQSPVTQIDTTINSAALERYSKFISKSTATPFAAYFAVYNILLYKYSAQTSFAVGTAVTQRSMAQLQEVIGFFANMLPIRTTIDEDMSFSDYLKGFREELMNGLAHDDVTYEDIVSQGKTSSQDRSYFKHLFAPGGLNLGTISKVNTSDLYPTSILSLPNGEETYEFLLTVHYKTGEAILRFDNYLYSEETARQFLDAYCGLVDTLSQNPDIKIRDISAVSDNELTRLVKELSTTGPVEPVERLLHHLFEAQSLKTPTAVAVEFESEYMTYSQLNAKANQLARILIQQGVGPETVVALCFDRGITQILSIIAVLKAGGAFVPLDPDDPTIRKELLVAECNAKVLLTSYTRRRDFEKSLASKVIVAYVDDDTVEKRLSRLQDTNLDIAGLTPSNLAYVMFTSGTTGKPKGVIIEHRSINNLVQNSKAYGYREGARVLSSLQYTFDPFVADVFGTLSTGGTLITGRKELVLGDIPKAIRSLRANVVHCTPSILSVVPVEHYPTLETVVVAGEALGRKLIEDWAKRVRFINMYGPTEATVDCVSCHVTDTSLTGVLGRPLRNNRLYILDEKLNPTPIGVEGELFIGGIQLARGYLNEPELTASSFVANPFVPGERIYHTGDIAMYRSDGNIVYCGRKDRQIKLRGQRVELSEVEDVINKYPGVQRSAALIRTLHDAPAIVAFVEFKGQLAGDDLEDEKDAVKIHISERLPRFMYPSLIVAIPLPTSSTGKISRRELMELNLSPFSEVSSDIGAPQSEVEVGLQKILSQLLQVDENSFGVTQDLFSLGMNSLMAVQVAGIVSGTFNVHIGLNNVYLRPTIRELGNEIVDAMGQDQRQIMQAEDTDTDFLIEFLPIKKKGIKPRLFLIHDVTGMATPFMRLGAYMSNEMWAIGDRDFGKETGFKSIESMADHYITLIKSVQPEGPYLLSGYSMGGLVALSMASKLTKAGESVSRLIIFDTIFIPTKERHGLKSSDWTVRAIDRISQNFPEIGDKWKRKLAVEIRKNMDFTWDFEPPHYDGLVTLIVPKDRIWYRGGHASDFDTGIDDRNGWDYRMSNLEMKVAGGRHDTMFTAAHVKTLAQVLKEVIAAIPLETSTTLVSE